MRATEIIRGVLDLIDQVECAQQEPQQQDPIGGAFAQLFAQTVIGSQLTMDGAFNNKY